jgi:hypothetical protein
MSSTLVRDKKTTEKKDTRRDGSEVDVVDNAPTEVASSEAIQKALDILAEHKLTSTFRDEARSRGAVGVTTFINDGNKSTLTKEALVATEVGTSLDYVVRKFIEFGGDADKTFKYIFETFSHHTLRGMKVSPIQGLDWKMLKTFIDNISTLKSFFESRGEVIVPFDTAFNEVLKSNDGSYANLTAIPDIITIDGKGELHIYDMKSYLASGISLKAFPGFNKGTEVKVARGAYLDENAGEEGKWQQQTSLYAHVVEKATGLKVASIGIVPIPVRYSSAGTQVTEDAISGIGVKSITNADGSQFKLDKVPTFYIDAIKLDILPLSKIKSNVWQNPFNEEDQREPEVETVSDEDNGDAPSKDPEKPIKELVPKVNEKPGGDVAGDDFGFGEFGGRRGRGRGRNTSNGNPKETNIIKCG